MGRMKTNITMVEENHKPARSSEMSSMATTMVPFLSIYDVDPRHFGAESFPTPSGRIEFLRKKKQARKIIARCYVCGKPIDGDERISRSAVGSIGTSML